MDYLCVRHVLGHVSHEVLHSRGHRGAILPLAVKVEEFIPEKLSPLQKASARRNLPGLQGLDLSLSLPSPPNFLDFFLLLDFLFNFEFFKLLLSCMFDKVREFGSSGFSTSSFSDDTLFWIEVRILGLTVILW